MQFFFDSPTFLLLFLIDLKFYFRSTWNFLFDLKWNIALGFIFFFLIDPTNDRQNLWWSYYLNFKTQRLEGTSCRLEGMSNQPPAQGKSSSSMLSDHMECYLQGWRVHHPSVSLYSIQPFFVKIQQQSKKKQTNKKTVFLTSLQNFICSNLCPFHPGLYLCMSEKTCLWILCTLLLGSCRWAPSPLAFSSLNKSIFLNLSSYIM